MKWGKPTAPLEGHEQESEATSGPRWSDQAMSVEPVPMIGVEPNVEPSVSRFDMQGITRRFSTHHGC